MAGYVFILFLLLFLLWAIVLDRKDAHDSGKESFTSVFLQEFSQWKTNVHTTQSKSSVTSPIGLLGTLGAIFVLIGIFLPFIHFSYFQMSYWDYLSSTPNFLFFFMLTLLISMTLFLLSKHIFALISSLILGLLFWYNLCISLEASLESTSWLLDAFDLSIFDFLSTGAWVMAVGYILMLLSPFLNSLNSKLCIALNLMPSNIPPADD